MKQFFKGRGGVATFIVLILVVPLAAMAAQKSANQAMTGASVSGMTSERPQNCVNEGGTCDGSVPCCQGADCVRKRCRVVPEDEMPILRIEPHQISRLCLNVDFDVTSSSAPGAR